MKSSLKCSMLAAVALMAFSASGSAETFYVGCNLNGLDKMSPEKASEAFFRRLGNNGAGNGGESVDILVDLATGNVTITCTKTADENTQGTLYVQIPGGPLLNLGPFWPEVDPNVTPSPP